eukprot:COSAG02_NODE_2273_length_9263_cov_10.296377_1_plen_780_part_10
MFTLFTLSIRGQLSTRSRLSVTCGLAQVHLTETIDSELLSHSSADSTAVVQEWFRALLQRRIGTAQPEYAQTMKTQLTMQRGDTCLAVEDSKTREPAAMDASQWTSDDEVRACTQCRKGFGFYRRKHHCRRCGSVFCWECSSKKLTLRDAIGASHASRVCDACTLAPQFELVHETFDGDDPLGIDFVWPMVERVQPMSQAAAREEFANLVDGGLRIVAVQGRDVTKVPMDQAAVVFAKAGRPVRLTFARYHRDGIAPDAAVNEIAAITTGEFFSSRMEPQPKLEVELEPDLELQPEPEPELEPDSEPELELEVHAIAKLPVSYKLSSWQARGVVADWLERQAAHGRSKLLVPELLSLEEVLVKWSQDNPKAWIRALRQLVQELRWGIGTFWAAHYDTSPARARAMFVANVCGNGPLYLSEANARLGAHRMCLPMRVAISPTIHQLMGHSDDVNSASFSPDGTKVVSGSHDQTVRIWDAVTGECEQTLQGHSSHVTSASFSPDGTKVVSGSHDRTVRIWDAVTGECEQTLQGHSSYVRSASFSPDGTKVVSGSHDQTVRIWDAVTGECEQTLQGHSAGVRSASFSPDGTKVVSGSQDQTVRIWDAVTGECEQTLQGHSGYVRSASFSPDGTKVVSGSDDQTVRIWDAVTGECEQLLQGHSGYVTSASFSPDGTKVVSGSDDKTVRIWDAVMGECEQTLQGHSSNVTSASFSPDGTKVVSGSKDKTVRIWDAVTGECEQTLQGHSSHVTSASFSPDGTKVVSGSDDQTVRIWDAVTGECEQT